MKRPNVWHQAIVLQLQAAGGVPLDIDQIWQRMEAAGFRHASKTPRATLGGRLAELVRLKKLTRVSHATYVLSSHEEDAANAEQRRLSTGGHPAVTTSLVRKRITLDDKEEASS